MVFSSIPLYLDPPTWNQHQAQQTTTHNGNGGCDAAHLPPPPSMAPTPRPELGSPGSIKPGSMADRARLAKAPPPEPSLKCPRCESTNTKFCYYNNYSLSQPRHFCKTCRRYWTRGGALRNVPVGGGCRRNKRSKASSSTSSKSTSAASTAPSSSSIAAGVIPQPPHLPFLASLHAFGDYTTTSIGLNFGGIQPIDPGAMEYQAGSSSNLGLDQWKLQHHQMQPFSFMGGLEPVQGLLPFDEEGGQGPTGYPVKQASSALISQLAAVKMEDDSQGLSLPRHYLGIPGNDQYWSGPASGPASGCGWTTDLSGFSSSTSGSLL